METIEVRETDTDVTHTNANTIDLSGVTATDFTQLKSTLIRAEGGNDIITGSQLNDRIEGGKGNDVVQDNGGGVAEHFIVSANGQRVTATRDGAPFFLDIGTAETPALNMNGGDDSADINNGLGALIKVAVNAGDGNDTVKAGRAAVKVRCPAGESSCKGTLRILRGGKVVGSIAINLKGGQAKVSKINSRKTRIALAKSKGKKLGATLKVTAKDAAGNTGRSSTKLTLKG